MTWTYDGTPGSSDRDAVRFLIGDTDTNDQLVTDEEIAWLLTSEANVYLAAAAACNAIISGQRLTDKQIDGLRVSGNQRIQAYRALAADMRARSMTTAQPFGGGISISDKIARDDDTDVRTPAFSLGQFDNPAVGAQPGDGDRHVSAYSTDSGL